MFGKISKNKFAGILYDTVLSETNMLGKKMKENELLKDKLYIDRNTFTEVSMLFHLNAYRDLLIRKYPPQSVFEVLMLCIDELAAHSTKFQPFERNKAFKEMFMELMGVTNKSTKEAALNNEDPVYAFAVAMIGAFFTDQINTLTEEEDGASFESLINCVADHIKQLKNNSSIMNLKVRM